MTQKWNEKHQQATDMMNNTTDIHVKATLHWLLKQIDIQTEFLFQITSPLQTESEHQAAIEAWRKIQDGD